VRCFSEGAGTACFAETNTSQVSDFRTSITQYHFQNVDADIDTPARRLFRSGIVDAEPSIPAPARPIELLAWEKRACPRIDNAARMRETLVLGLLVGPLGHWPGCSVRYFPNCFRRHQGRRPLSRMKFARLLLGVPFQPLRSRRHYLGTSIASAVGRHRSHWHIAVDPFASDLTTWPGKVVGTTRRRMKCLALDQRTRGEPVDRCGLRSRAAKQLIGCERWRRQWQDWPCQRSRRGLARHRVAVRRGGFGR
jgi:hypothetical protein